MTNRKNIIGTAVVVVNYEVEIADMLLRAAELEIERSGLPLVCVLRTKSSLQTPLLVNVLMDRKDVCSVIVLGCILNGESKQGEVKWSSVVTSLLLLSASQKKPVGIAIIGPKISVKQARSRVAQYVSEAVSSCTESRDLLQSFK